MSTGSIHDPASRSIGRIASVTGSKAILLLDPSNENDPKSKGDRPEMGIILAIDTPATTTLAIVSALSVPVPAQGGESEIWIAELGLVGELQKDQSGQPIRFSRGTTIYPTLGDRVRFSTKEELELTYSSGDHSAVRVGSIRQDASIAAMIRVDELLGKHFAVLGTTGTGKSCTTALILRAILEKNANAHIVLLDPHNEYATAFGERAEIISPRNMQMPLWLLNFEEAVEVLVGDPTRKGEIEILQELIPIAKGRYNTGRAAEPTKLRKMSLETGRFTVDTPVPYRISDLTSLIDERMGKLENRKDLAPYRQLKTRIETISQDGRYAFMFGSVTVYDGMAQVLSRVFRVPVNGKPITIVELTGLPPEVVNVVVSVLCRMAFDFALWGEAKVPVTLICEEAHRYVPLNPKLGFEPCKRALAKIAKEGRKYGCSLCIVTQRPAEIDPTILSQCNTVFALRMSNDRDQAIVNSAITDTGSGLLEFLPALGHREAIAFGDGVPLPVRIRFDEIPQAYLPRSSTAQFSEKWQTSVEDETFLDAVVERWRAAGVCGGLDASAQASLLADAVNIPQGLTTQRQTDTQPNGEQPAAGHGLARDSHALSAHGPSSDAEYVDKTQPAARPAPTLRSQQPAGGSPTAAASRLTSAIKRTPAPAEAAAEPVAANGTSVRASLRERLLRPQPPR
jgi:DNA helicase HerA-like ATPase